MTNSEMRYRFQRAEPKKMYVEMLSYSCFATPGASHCGKTCFRNVLLPTKALGKRASPEDHWTLIIDCSEELLEVDHEADETLNQEADHSDAEREGGVLASKLV